MTLDLERCLDAAMQHYPKGTTYRVLRGQSWDDAAYASRRAELTPLVRAVLRAAGVELPA